MKPRGRSAREGSVARASHEAAYEDARAEYASIRELRKKNWIAAHIRERRYELGLTQRQVADAAGTSHSYISRVEKGDHLPTLAVLQRVLAVLDLELRLTIIDRGAANTRSEAAPVPALPTV